ncbi:MAG: cysteine--tRNA ligase [Lentisphaerae bacterium]|nr:cysteine--tRNA ligase [Lentisphaerota bacterium]
MQFYNTLTRSKETFEPLESGHARLYTCGPTVYNFAHIGNFRAYLFEDLLRRTLRYAGLRVTQVMNLTDVDDKTIRGASAASLPLKTYTQPYVEAFFDDLKALNIEPAEVYPAATDHIPEMIVLVQTLLDKGLAYRTEDGSVYFKVDAFPRYGRLAHLDRAGLQIGTRVALDEYDKENVGDFALWKGWDEKDGEVAWDAPWGRGRPGWHIECSAMSMKYLGASFDIHTGGIDNLFPHHENEIAQAEGATGQPFVRYWLHCAHLRVNGEKMSKSLGNFYTLRDLITKGWGGRWIRYVLISGHYRQPLNFTFDALEASRAALSRIDAFIDQLADTAGGCEPSEGLPVWAASGRDAFNAAVFDDLNLPEALAALFGMVRDGNAALSAGAVTSAEAAAVAALLKQLDRVLGVLDFGRVRDEAVPAAIQQLFEARSAARKGKNWAESDRLRDAIASAGWEVRDSKDGQKLKKR